MPYRSAPVTVVDFAGASITGKQREVNEDAWAALPAASVFLVADGCGGVSSGRVAADIALRAVERALAEARRGGVTIEPLAAALHLANEEVLAAAAGPLRGMGAALAALRLDPPWAVAVSVGDCRVYRYRLVGRAPHRETDERGGTLEPLTSDDTLVSAMLRADVPAEQVLEVARVHGSVITKALGTSPRVDLDVGYSLHEPGDLYLLCSDGVTRALGASDLRAGVSTPGVPLAQRCQRLLQLADDRAGHDNATAVLVQG